MARLVVLGFFAVSAWNNINDIEAISQRWTASYNKQTELLTSEYNVKLDLVHENVAKLGQGPAELCLYLSYAIMSLCVLGLLKPCFGSLAAFLWLLTEVLEKEFLMLTQNRNLKQLEVLAMTTAIFASALLVCCGASKSKCCAKKAKTEKPAKAGKTGKKGKSGKSAKSK